MKISPIRLLPLLLFCLYTATIGQAQTLRQRPLRGISADSVVFLSKDQTNLRMAGMIGTTPAMPRPLTEWRKKDVKALLKTASTPQRPTLTAPQSVYEAISTIQHCLPLLRWTGEARYCDSLNEALFNQLMPALLTKTFEQHLAQQAVVDATQWMYLTDEQGVFINLYLNAFARIVTPKFALTLDQTSRMPFGSRVQLRIGGLKSQTPLELRLFIPSWQKTTPIIYVNGREEVCTIEKGYAVIRRKWNAGDEVFFDFDLTPRIEGALLRVGSLFYVPTAEPSLPAYPSNELNRYEHPILQGKGFTAEPITDKPILP